MTALRDRLAVLAQRTEREMKTLWRRRLKGQISEAVFVAMAASVLARARAQGVTLADLGLAAVLTKQLKEVVSPAGVILPDNDLDRLHDSVRSVINQPITTATTPEELALSRELRLARLGRDSAAEAMTWGVRMAALSLRAPTRWIRRTDLDPCKVCSNLADGVARSWKVPMKRHGGCLCIQMSVLN